APAGGPGASAGGQRTPVSSEETHASVPASCVSAPVFAFRAKTAIAPLFEAATYRFRPSGLRARPEGVSSARPCAQPVTCLETVRQPSVPASWARAPVAPLREKTASELRLPSPPAA